MADKGKTVSLILGSGGARGLAHIGVIRELEDRKFRVRSISGCSMGALVGGIYAAGKLEEFESWVRAIDNVDIVSLLDIAWQKHGLVKGDKFINTLIELVGDRMIEDLPMPFTAVAADVRREREVWLTTGKLFDAIRASISLPLFFTPVEYRNGHLIDGGVLNPVPIAPTFNDDTDIKIAVNLGGPVEKKYRSRPPRSGGDSELNGFREKVRQFIDELKESVLTRDEGDWSAYDIADQAFDAMQGAIARQKLAAYPPDIEIQVARNACGTLEFDRADEMIALGREKAAQALDGVS
jgi:NTE family protein